MYTYHRTNRKGGGIYFVYIKDNIKVSEVSHGVFKYAENIEFDFEK